MRTTLVPSMLNAISRNQKKGNLEGRLFEIAKIFIPKELPLTDYPDERDTLCVGVFGQNEDFFTLKGIAETVADTFLLDFEYEEAEKSFLHPYQTAVIKCEGEEIGYLGKLAYDIADKLDLRNDAYVMQIDLAKLAKWNDKKAVFKPLPKFAEESRDLDLVMTKDITCKQVEDVIGQSCNYIKNIRLFDVYEGAGIADDKKSMAFTVEFCPKDEAFESDSVDHFVNKILKNLKKELDIDLRS